MIAFDSGAIMAMASAAARAAMAAAAVGAGLWVLRVRNVKAQKAAWTLVLAGAFLVPFLTPWLARQSWAPRWLPDASSLVSAAKTRVAAMREARVEAAPVQASVTPAIQNVPPSSTAQDWPTPIAAMQEVASSGHESAALAGPQLLYPKTSPHSESAWSVAADIAWALYLGIAAALVLRLLYSLSIVAELWLEGEPIEVGSHHRVRVHNRITAPVTIGSGILLPAEHRDWDSEKLRIVLAHEGEHVRQGDFYLQLAASLYAAIFWPSPLGWWLKRKLSDLGEAISDGAAVQQAESRASYAELLLEFAAMPYTAQMGVAMARPGRMTERMERLLNETRFQQSFTGSRGRLLAAVALAPLAVFAATALARAQAQQATPTPAPQSTTTPSAAPDTPATGVSHPSEAPIEAAPEDSVTTIPAPPTSPAPQAPPPAPSSQDATPNLSFSAPNVTVNPDKGLTINGNPNVSVSVQDDSSPVLIGRGRTTQVIDDHGDGGSYAIITGHGHPYNSHAHSLPDGDYLWFKRSGKEYVVTDPQVLARIHAIYQPMNDLGAQMKQAGTQEKAEMDAVIAASGFDRKALNQAMAEFQAQQPEFQREMKALQDELTHISIPKVEPIDPKAFEALKADMANLKFSDPDFDAKMADLSTKMATLRIPKVQIDEKKMAEINTKIAKLTNSMSLKQTEIASKQQYLNSEQYRNMSDRMAKMSANLGKQGSEMGRMAKDADRQVRSIIDESLKNGTAKPVQ